MTDYVADLRSSVTTAAAKLATVSPELAAQRPASGGWSAKEIIGHLIDSASNNHQRFVRAQFKDDLVFPGYEQDGWVAAQQYQNAPWPELVELWRDFNLHIARVMAAVPAEIRFRETRKHNFHEIASHGVPEGEPTTLDYFMSDYVWHLQHHLRQIHNLGLSAGKAETA